MPMQQFDAKELLSRYVNGACSEAEKALVERWYMQFNEDNIDIPAQRIEELGLEVFSALSLKGAGARTRKLWVLRIAAAAIFASLLGTFLFFERGNKPNIEQAKNNFPSVIENGITTGEAVMTLADGKKINLSGAGNEQLKQFGLELITTAGAERTYKITGKADQGLTSGYHSISTAKGADLRILLPDETRVWLNAGTTLIFPIGFAEKRNLSLIGEAYFEVSKDRAHPFVVLAPKQRIEVLGTHFNMTAYTNEKYAKTTLIEGSLKVTALTADGAQDKVVLLKPNEQAISTEGQIRVESIDAKDAVAWKNGEFVFRNKKLEDIMTELARWYDIEVVYQDTHAGAEIFGGSISRFAKIEEVLSVLELTGSVHFKIQGKKILIRK
ncbi:MAG TPA: FecR domain-containing protein [Pedobacter sp.]|nr:FecR domain-containing protein [Pedobacter sp.]